MDILGIFIMWQLYAEFLLIPRKISDNKCLDLIQNCISARSALLKATYLEALLYIFLFKRESLKYYLENLKTTSKKLWPQLWPRHGYLLNWWNINQFPHAKSHFNLRTLYYLSNILLKLQDNMPTAQWGDFRLETNTWGPRPN